MVNEDVVNIPYAKNGDILITSANGSSKLIGKHAIIHDIQEKSTVPGGFMLIASSDEPEFINASMSSPWYTKFINVFVSGGNGSIGNLSKVDLDEQYILVPCKEEREKIGSYFSNLDNLITLHQRKYFNAMNIKKIALLKFFSTLSHEIYRQFTNSWEQRKAKELFVATADKGHPELPVLSATQDRGMIRRDENSINVYHDKKNEAGYKRVLPGQFVIHLRSFQGGFAHSTIEGITSPAYTVFDFSDTTKHDSEYWKHVFTSKEFIQRLETVTYGIRDGRSISYNEFLTMEFIYPSKKEQTEIARYLNGLDTLITLHQHENLKGGLL